MIKVLLIASAIYLGIAVYFSIEQRTKGREVCKARGLVYASHLKLCVNENSIVY